MRDITAKFKGNMILIHWFSEGVQGTLTVTEDQAEKLCNSLSFAIADSKLAGDTKDVVKS